MTARILHIIRFVSFLALGLFFTETASAQTLVGIYIGNVTPPLNPKVIAALQEPWVDGIYLDLNWDAVEPQEGGYDWSAADQAIAKVEEIAANNHKKLWISIGVAPGRFSPQWVQSKVPSMATVVPYNHLDEYAPVGSNDTNQCKQAVIPAFWDPRFLAIWDNFIMAFGEHYANNPSIISVKFAGINMNTPELMEPHFTGKENFMHCQSHDDVASAIAMGATEEKIIYAFENILNAYHKAFPKKYIVTQGCSNGQPLPSKAIGPADPRTGRATSNPRGAAVCAEYMLPYAEKTMGKKQFVTQVNDWKIGSLTKWREPSAASVEYGVRGGKTGLQMASNAKASCIGGLSSGECNPVESMRSMVGELETHTKTHYIEAFPGDLINPELGPIWTSLRSWLYGEAGLSP
jgi:hypothetical protein